MTLQEAHELIYTELGYCACAETEPIELIKYFLHYAGTKEKNWNFFVEKFFNGNAAAAYCLAFLLEKADLIEHGTSIRYFWLTDKGLKFANVLFNYKIEEVLNGVPA